jgi:hypothetical protein
VHISPILLRTVTIKIVFVPSSRLLGYYLQLGNKHTNDSKKFKVGIHLTSYNQNFNGLSKLQRLA